MAEKVTLLLYDLGGGLFKGADEALETGELLLASVLVFGNEFLYAGKICCERPRATIFGAPTKEVVLGITEVTQSDFGEYLQAARDQFSEAKFDAVNHGSIAFAASVAEFLTGAALPPEVVVQPPRLSKSSTGLALKSLIKQIEKVLEPLPRPPASEQAPAAPANQEPPRSEQRGVIEVGSLAEFRTATSGSKKVVIDFYADWCGPCKQIKPVYHELERNFGADVKFVAVNVDRARDVASQFQVRAMPTFVALLNGSLYDRLEGANPAKLKSLVQVLSSK